MEGMPELSGDKVDRLSGQAEAARAVLRFTEQWTKTQAFPSAEFGRGVFHAAETLARWTHERFGIPPDPVRCPCYHCWRNREPHGT